MVDSFAHETHLRAFITGICRAGLLATKNYKEKGQKVAERMGVKVTVER